MSNKFTKLYKRLTELSQAQNYSPYPTPLSIFFSLSLLLSLDKLQTFSICRRRLPSYQPPLPLYSRLAGAGYCSIDFAGRGRCCRAAVPSPPGRASAGCVVYTAVQPSRLRRQTPGDAVVAAWRCRCSRCSAPEHHRHRCWIVAAGRAAVASGRRGSPMVVQPRTSPQPTRTAPHNPEILDLNLITEEEKLIAEEENLYIIFN
ncbi:uncharacterized protein LOC121800836 [Salvia splendens]|uniref:uncharacterized protein LOC121800836 n=1 Tax=Salvia splendens TaxID=180675 RepID=UPI001C26E0CE|nr:uncharacterized protein LOC121800836 [Salvia splendens]